MATKPLKDFEGYAKIHGYDFDYILHKLSVVLGRKTKRHKNVDVDLHHKNVSRQHAKLVYNLNKKQWEIKCLGKNGIKVGRKTLTPSSPPHPLEDGSQVRIGDAIFIFQLPNPETAQKFASKQAAESIEDTKSYEKPSQSYATLIGQALSASPTKRLTLKEIYQYIMDNYPYFRTSEVGWKSSVRHNLSLNKFFYRVPQEECDGKRAMYGLNLEYEQDLLNGLTGRRANKKRNANKKKSGETKPRGRGKKRKASETENESKQAINSSNASMTFPNNSTSSPTGSENPMHSLWQMPMSCQPQMQSSPAAQTGAPGAPHQMQAQPTLYQIMQRHQAAAQMQNPMQNQQQLSLSGMMSMSIPPLGQLQNFVSQNGGSSPNFMPSVNFNPQMQAFQQQQQQQQQQNQNPQQQAQTQQTQQLQQPQETLNMQNSDTSEPPQKKPKVE